MKRRRRLVIWAGVVLLLAAAVIAFQPVWVVDLVAAAAPTIVFRVPTREALVALTFDDGPDPEYTPVVLDKLKGHGVRATFFLIGERAEGNRKLMERIRAEGHAVGNHTWREKPSTFKLSTVRFEEELKRTEAVLGLEGDLKLLRPGGGLIRPAQRERAAALGYTLVLGSAFPYDPSRPPVGYMRWLVRKNLRAGAIVVLHDSGGGKDRSRTVAAVDGIIEDGRAMGFRWVTVPELLAAGRTQPE